MSRYSYTLWRLKEVSKFFQLFQIQKSQEIYFSPYHVIWRYYTDFAEIYLWEREFQHIHVYFSSDNINFKPSYYNIPIFPNGEKLLRAYTDVMVYFWSSIEMVVYDGSHYAAQTWRYEIDWLLFFDEKFHLYHSCANIKFKLEQVGSEVYMWDSIREIMFHRFFTKYVASKNFSQYYDIYLSTVNSLFIPLDTDVGRIFQAKAWNIWKGKVRWVARILDREKLSVRNEWMNNFNKWDIIIAHSTDVFYMPYIFECGWIITENQNLLSHASLISRELNIPLVLGFYNIFLKIFDGDYIELDSDTGEVIVLKRFWEI